MNERIRRLMEQAVTSIDGQTFGKTYIPDEFTEKFAELIVRECIGVVQNLPAGYKDYRDQIEDAFRNDAVAEIKHKFGIEE